MVGWECPTKPREASELDPEAVHLLYYTDVGPDIRWVHLRPRLEYVAKIIRLGFPTAFEQSMTALAFAALGLWVVRVPVTYYLLFVAEWGPTGIWTGVVLGDVVGALAAVDVVHARHVEGLDRRAGRLWRRDSKRTDRNEHLRASCGIST